MAVALLTSVSALDAGPSHATESASVARVSDAGAEQQLAERYAPVLRLRAQEEPCGTGEPYEPIDVDALMGNDEVALRGPWDPVNLIRVAPTAADLSRGLPGYHLDFPGDALDPGCVYEQFSDRLAGSTQPTAYARVATEGGHQGKLAVQYWFFYVYNDYNNKHEGDWEMIQLVFDATDAAEALAESPVEVGYSQHEGAERAVWGSEKLELADGTHPVVYPAEGSHANFFSPALYLGRSGEQGVGCDDAGEPHRTVRPQVAYVPPTRDAYVAEYPWLGFSGRWGEMHEAFYDGPTGPSAKQQWTHPISWSQDSWRDSSFPVPLGGAFGTSATDFFCASVAAGSNVLRALARNPAVVLFGLSLLALLVLWAASRTRWVPAVRLPLVQQRAWGEILVAARRTYGSQPLLFAGLGVTYLVTAVLATVAQALLFGVTRLEDLRTVAGSTGGYVVGIVLALGAVFSLLAFVVVLAATAWTLYEIDQGRPVTVGSAFRNTLARVRALAMLTAITVPVVLVLSSTIFTAPLAVVFLVRRLWAVHAVMVEDLPWPAALRRSRALVAGHWWRAALFTAVVAGIGALTGPLVGVGLLFVSSASFSLVNAVASLVYAVTIPYVALALTYLYADLRARSTVPEKAVVLDS